MIPFNPQNRLRRGLEFRDVEELRQVTQRRRGPRQASEQNLAGCSLTSISGASRPAAQLFLHAFPPTHRPCIPGNHIRWCSVVRCSMGERILHLTSQNHATAPWDTLGCVPHSNPTRTLQRPSSEPLGHHCHQHVRQTPLGPQTTVIS